MAAPWEKYQAQAQDGPWAKYAAQSAPQADTAADSAARGLPPLNPQPRRTGFAGQVADTMSGRMDQPSPPVPTGAQLAHDYGQTGIGVVTGMPGIFGNVEAAGRYGLNQLGANVSPQTTFATSSQIGNRFFGAPQTEKDAQLRGMGEIASPVPGLKALDLAGAATRLGAKGAGVVGAHTLGAVSGTSGRAIQEGFQAAKQSIAGDASKDMAFTTQMRGGSATAGDVVQQAKRAVEQLRRERSAVYRAGIGSTIKGDPAILDFAPIDEALSNVADIKSFKGQSLSTVADKAKQRINEVVAEWRALDPAEYHTPEGLDALKQKLGDLIYEGDLSSIKPNSPASIIVDNAYNAVKDQIVKQAPGYAKVMKDYSEASDELRNIEKTMSLGRNATTDQSLRKLQSIMRNNANTNYGARVQMGDRLSQQPGGETLIPALAGQQMSSYVPRGIAGGVAPLEFGALAMSHPLALPALAGQSPRVIGELARGAGKVSGYSHALADALKSKVVPGGGASVSGIDPRLIGMMTPQVLARLLAQPQNAVQ